MAIDTSMMTPKQKAVLEANKARDISDPSRLIFPAGQAAPSGIAPAAPVSLSPEQALQFPKVTERSPAQTEEDFVTQESSQPAIEAQATPDYLNTYENAVKQDAATQQSLASQESSINEKQAKILNDQAIAEAEFAKKKEDDVKVINDEITKHQEELDNHKIEPHSFFHNKSGWEKVIGGIGLFLGSITPDGANRVANIIKSEIDRDTEAQKMDYQLKKGKVDGAKNRYKSYMDKYKDDQMARLAMSREKLTAAEYQIKGLMAKSKSSRAIAAGEEGLARIAMEKDMKTQQMIAQKMKLEGNNLTGAQKTGFTNTLASAETIKGSLDELSSLVKGTGESIPFTEKNDAAVRLVGDIQLQLKEIKKLGVLSGDDSKRLDFYISNPSMFKSDERMEASIKGVRSLVDKAVKAQEKSLGMSKPLPFGAKVIK